MRDSAEEEDDQEVSAHMGYVSSSAIEQVWGKPKKKKKGGKWKKRDKDYLHDHELKTSLGCILTFCFQIKNKGKSSLLFANNVN